MVKSVDERVEELRKIEQADISAKSTSASIEAEALKIRQEQYKIAVQNAQTAKDVKRSQEDTLHNELTSFVDRIKPLTKDVVPFHARIWGKEDLGEIFNGHGIVSIAIGLSLLPLKSVFQLATPRVYSNNSGFLGKKVSEVYFSFEKNKRLVVSGSTDRPGLYDIKPQHYHRAIPSKKDHHMHSGPPPTQDTSRWVWSYDKKKLCNVALDDKALDFILDEAAKAKLQHQNDQSGNEMKMMWTTLALGAILTNAANFIKDDDASSKMELYPVKTLNHLKSTENTRQASPFETLPPIPTFNTFADKELTRDTPNELIKDNKKNQIEDKEVYELGQ